MPQDLTGMYDQSTDLDTRLEVASHLLKKAADEQGVDLESFSEEELGDMLTDMVSGPENEAAAGEDADDDEDEGEGEGGGEDKTAGQLTYPDVSYELQKRASVHGVNLAELSREEYQDLFNKVAQEMTDPDAQKLAAAEAQMDHLGRVAARAWADELDKIAADGDDDDDDMRRRRDRDKDQEKKAAIADKAKSLYHGAKGHAGKAWGKARAAEGRASETVGRKLRGSAGQRGDLAAAERKNKLTGRLAAGGAAAAAGGGGAYAGRKKKAQLEQVAYAIDVLRSEGYDL